MPAFVSSFKRESMPQGKKRMVYIIQAQPLQVSFWHLVLFSLPLEGLRRSLQFKMTWLTKRNLKNQSTLHLSVRFQHNWIPFWSFFLSFVISCLFVLTGLLLIFFPVGAVGYFVYGDDVNSNILLSLSDGTQFICPWHHWQCLCLNLCNFCRCA